MYHVQGFMVINSLIDNSLKNKISKLGELSPLARTFTREPGVYSHNDYDDVRLYTFYSQNENEKIVLDNQLAKQLLQIGNWLADQSLRNQFTADREVFKQLLTAEFASMIKVIQVGKMVTDERYWLPEYIQFTLLSDTRENRYKIWFCDEAFRNQYDKFELEIITPIRILDDFYKDAAVVEKLITDHTVINLHREVNEKMNKLPYTSIQSYTYDWIDPEDKTHKIPTTWTLLLYGNAANNADVIREALIDHVLANSDHVREQWQKLLPDLFIPTEFYICPIWTKFATPNKQLQGGIYSPLIPYREVLPWCKRTMIGYKEDHYKKYAVTFNAIFKSMGIIACGHPQNRLNPIEFEKTWPEYINVYTTSRDFNRVSPETQDFIMLLSSLLVEAETMTPDTEIPDVSSTLGGQGRNITGYTRVRRGDIYYITANFNNVQYLVPLRYNFLGEIALAQESSVATSVVNPTGEARDQNERIRDVIDLTSSINPRAATSSTTAQNNVAGADTNVNAGRTTTLTGTAPDADRPSEAANAATASNTATTSTTNR